MHVGYSPPLNSDTVVLGVAPSLTLSGKPLQGTPISSQSVIISVNSSF